jgi:hypothetical protein
VDDPPHVALRNSTEKLVHELLNFNGIKHFLFIKGLKKAPQILINILKDQVEL